MSGVSSSFSDSFSKDFVIQVPSEPLPPLPPKIPSPPAIRRPSKPSPLITSLPSLSPYPNSPEALPETEDEEKHQNVKPVNSNSSNSNSDRRCLKNFPYWLVCLLRALGFIVFFLVVLGLPDLIYTSGMNDKDGNPTSFLERTSHVQIGGMPTLNWAIYLSLSSIIHYSTLMVVSFLPNFIHFILKKTFDAAVDMQLEVYLNYFRAIRISLTVSLWLAFSNLAWSFYVLVPDWRWKRQLGVSSDASMWYIHIAHALLTLVTLSALWSIENLIIEVIATRFHRRAYGDRIKESEKVDLVIKKLSVSKNPKRSIISYQSSAATDNLNRAGAYIWNKAKSAILASQESTMKSLDASSLITLKSIPDTLEQAKQLTESLFFKLSRGQRSVQVRDFTPYFESPSKAKRAFSLFDKNDDGDLDFEELHSRLVEYTQEKIHLTESMMDMKEVVGSLHYFFRALFAFIGFLLTCIIFQLSVATYISALAAILIPMTFIFGNTLKETFECIIGIFIKHYYDVGDTLLIEKEVYMVKSISILTTVLERRDGKRVFAPNNVLNSKMIDNVRRSGFMSEEIEIKLDIQTTQEQLDELTTRMVYFLDSDSKHYFSNFSVIIKDVLLAEKALRCSIFLCYKFNWQEMSRKSQKRNAFMYALTENLKALDIRCPHVLKFQS